MSDVKHLIQAIALDRAYAMARDCCDMCGSPATRTASHMATLSYHCDECPPPLEYETKDLFNAPAIRKLVKLSEMR